MPGDHKLVAGLGVLIEACAVDAQENSKLPGVARLGQDVRAPKLGGRLKHEGEGIDALRGIHDHGVAGAQVLAAVDLLAVALAYVHGLVQQQEGRTVGEDLHESGHIRHHAIGQGLGERAGGALLDAAGVFVVGGVHAGQQESPRRGQAGLGGAAHLEFGLPIHAALQQLRLHLQDGAGEHRLAELQAPDLPQDNLGAAHGGDGLLEEEPRQLDHRGDLEDAGQDGLAGEMPLEDRLAHGDRLAAQRHVAVVVKLRQIQHKHGSGGLQNLGNLLVGVSMDRHLPFLLDRGRAIGWWG